MDQLAKRIPISLKLAGFSIDLNDRLRRGIWCPDGGLKKTGCWTMFWGHFPQWPLSLPGFWIAIVLIFIFAEQWKILPSSGISDGSGFIPRQSRWHSEYRKSARD